MQEQKNQATNDDNNDITPQRIPTEDPNNGGSVLKSKGAVRFIFFFSDKSLAEGNYCVHPFGSKGYHPFYIIDKNRYAYLCIYHDRESDDVRSDIEFNITSSKFTKNKNNIGPQHHQKTKIIKHNDCYPIQSAQTHTWTIRGGEHVYFVDFKNWNNWTKQNNYESIAHSIMQYILNLLGNELAPLSVLRIIFAAYKFFTADTDDRSLLRKNNVRNIFATNLTAYHNKIKVVKSWEEMSILLVCLGSLWSLETPLRTKYVTDTQMSTIYKHLCSAKRGTTDNILENVRHTFGEYITVLMDKLASKILSERQQITKYGYCLWYNLLHCVWQTIPKHSQSSITKVLQYTQQISNALYTTSLIQHLFTLVGFDLTFVRYERPIKMEYHFVRNLLSTKNASAQQLSSRVKSDFVIQLLAKFAEIEQVYTFLLSFKTDLRHLFANDTESWFGFVYYMLSACKIPKDKDIMQLQLSKAVIKCMELTSELFCYKVEQIDQQKDAESFYKLCTNFPVIIDEKIRQTISKNTYLNTQSRFIALFAVTWIEKMTVIKDTKLPSDIRAAAAMTIDRTWLKLKGEQRKQIEEICDEAVRAGQYDIASLILNKIIDVSDIFAQCKSDKEIVLYLASKDGKELMEILYKYKRFGNLAVQTTALHQFWQRVLSNMAVLISNFDFIIDISQRFGDIPLNDFPQNEGLNMINDDDEKKETEIKLDETTESVLNSHLSTTSEWHKDEVLLQKICNSAESITSYNLDDEKQEINLTEGEKLLYQHNKCNKIINTQSLRLESLPQNVRKVFAKQREIKNALKICQNNEKYHQNMLQQINRQYIECSNLRKELQEKLVSAHKQFNQEIARENVLFQQENKIKAKLNTKLEKELKAQSAQSANIIKAYKLYQKNNQINIAKLQEKLKCEWDKQEEIWWEWKISDIIAWIRCKLEWFNEETTPKGIDLNEIKINMKSVDLNGTMLENIEKQQLHEFGFNFQQIDVVYQSLKRICSLYPAPKDKEKKENNKNNNVEGMVEETYNNNIEIPPQFKCRLTKQIMENPVIAFDGHTYDKDAIVAHLKQYHKSPVTNEVCDGKDEMSFMLFDDDKLKKEINIFKQANNL